MKKSILLVLLLLVGVLGLVSCKPHEREEKDNGATPSAAVPSEEASAGPDATEGITASPIPSPAFEPDPTATPTPTPTPVPVLADRLEATEDPAVFNVSTLDLTCYDINVYRIQNKMVYFYNENSVSAPRIISYDIATGEKKEKVFEEIDPQEYDFEVINDECIAVTDENKMIHYLDADLNTLYTFNVPLDSLYPYYAVTKDYSKVYYIKEKSLYGCETATGTEALIYTDPILRDGYPLSVTPDGRFVSIYAYSRKTGQNEIHMYDIETGELTLLPDFDDYSKYYVSPDKKEVVIRDFAEDTFKLYRFDDEVPKDLMCMLDNGSGIPEDYDESLKNGEAGPGTVIFDGKNYKGTLLKWIDWERRLFILVDDWNLDSSYMFEFTCYELDTGKPVSNFFYNLESPNYPIYCYSVDLRDGYMFFSGNKLDVPFCVAWKYEDGTLEDMSKKYVRLNHIPEYLDNKRKELEEKYDIYIYLGSEAFATDHDYYLECCTDAYTMYRTLCMVDEVFSWYPRDLFDNLKYSETKTFAVYLCDGFIKKESYGIADAVALANTEEYERYIALDVSYYGDMRSNIVHELSHCIDNRIIQEYFATGEFDFEEEWLKLNPEDYYYMYDYNETSPFSRYTYPYAEKDAYFIDTYSLTKPTEDRARLFENLVRRSFGYDYFESSALREKLHFYFDHLRKCLATEEWPEETIWEKKLRLLDEMYAGDESITYEMIYPEAYNGDEYYYLGDPDYIYLSAYACEIEAVG